ncbi:hypothetical protein ACFQ2M_07525 [Kitasatospora saccharophila]|uniref:hypothetical protein n=1 Tax=Kitasatospora saccharophila TaxID=407973 RepID=UPI0036272BBB
METVAPIVEQAPGGGVAGWAAGLVDTLGGPGAGLAIALESLLRPLPSEVILPLTGFTEIGSLAWNGVLITAGYLRLLGERWGLVEDCVGVFSEAVPVLAVAALAGWPVLRLRGRSARHRREG